MKNTNCGGCEAVQLRTPMLIKNRAGLSAVDYRIGDYRDFKASLLSKLTVRQLKGLKKLTTRSDDDFTIALIDAFSILADVLTFYQERIVNESYLKTATERMSVAELAAMIGYELNPGVAATTYLSFTVDENSMQAGEESIRKIKSSGNEKPIIKIEKGVKSQSIPEQDEEPQIFETVEDIQAKADWNSMPVKCFVNQEEISEANIIFIQGTNNNIKKGDQILIVEGDDKTIKKVIKTEFLNDTDTTQVYFENKPYYLAFTPVFYSYPMSNFYTTPYILNTGAIEGLVGTTNKVSSFELQSALAIQNWSSHEFKTSVNISKPVVNQVSKVYVFRNSACLFGYNAPKIITKIITKTDDDEKTTITESEHYLEEINNEITLDAEYPKVTGGEDAYIALKKSEYASLTPFKIKTSELVPQTKYGISGKSTKIGINGLTWPNNTNIGNLRSSIVYIQSERIDLAQKPITDPLKKGTSEIILSKFYVDLQVGQKILISGEVSDLPGIVRTEIHTIQEVALVNKYTQIITERSLENSFVRKSVRINANVALATHGETVSEVLGSGDARVAFQKFELKHAPLTYIADTSFSGSSSTIEITVNDILWKEVPYFYDRSAEEQVYIVRKSNDESTTITFGDGIHGGRLPTGTLNIRATYRKGIGSKGLLKSNQITQLISKPLYLKSAHNPIATSGAEDGEDIEDARFNANLSIRTLDRIVSLKDYEDFAESFAGIEKAKSVWLWSQSGKKVFLTVAGSGGAEIPENSRTLKNLNGAILKYSYPGVQVQIKSFEKRYFRIIGSLKVQEDFDFQKVHDEVVHVLINTYSFKNRSIGQNIHLSEVISVIESIEGVKYINIDELIKIGPNESLNLKKTTLVAKLINSGNTKSSASELIMLDPSPLTFNKIV